MIKNSRVSFALAIIILLFAAGLRLWQLPTLPYGLHNGEITNITLANTIRSGDIRVFYDIGGGEGRENLYAALLAVTTVLVGQGIVGYTMPSIWAGLITLALTYALAKRLYGHLAALLAMALLAVSMWPVLLSRDIGREALLPLLVSAVMLALALALPVYWRRRGDRTLTSSFAFLAVLLGVGFYIHPTGLMIALFVVVFIAYMLLARHRLNRQTLGYIGFTALIVIIIATPYLTSALNLPELSGVVRVVEGLQASGTNLIQTIANGIGGLFIRGDADPAYNIPGRPLFDPVTMLLILVGLGLCGRYVRKPRYALPLLALVILLPLALLHPNAPHFPAFAPVLPVLALLFGLGGAAAVKWSRQYRYAQLALVGLIFAITGWTLVSLFGTWHALPEVYRAYRGRLGEVAHHLDITSDQIPTVFCGENAEPVHALGEEPTPAQLVRTMMHHRDAPLRYVDCNRGLVMIGGGETQQVVTLQNNLSETTNPFVQEWLSLAQPDTRLPNNTVWLMNVSEQLANRLGRFQTTTPVTYPPEAGMGSALVPPPIRFGGNLTFLGYDLPAVDYYPPGGFVTVITYWRVDGALPRDLRLFTHVLSDPSSRPPAQTDEMSVNPAEMQNRDIFMQVTYIPLPEALLPGTYTVSVGAYQSGDQQRMAVFDQNGEVVSTRLLLYDIDVRPSES